MSQLDLAWPDHEWDRVPQDEPSPAGLCLVTPITESTWLGRDSAGRVVTARRLADLPDPAGGSDPAAIDAVGVIEHGAALAAARTPSLVSVLGVQRLDRSLWLVSEADRGVGLGRLLRLTRLTPAQAVLIGLGAACGVRALHLAGYAHGRISPAEVRVGEDGRVRLDGWAAGVLLDSEEPRDRRQRADVVALGRLLTELGRAARGAPSAAGAAAPELLAALDAAADYAALPGAVIELVAGPLEAVCDPDQEATARSELTGLVAVITGSGPASGSYPSPSVPPPDPDPAREVWWARLGAGLRRVWQRIWTWVVALAVLAAAVALEFVFLHDRLTQDMRLLLNGAEPGQRAESSAGPPSATLPPIPSPVPASAGPVVGLDLRALQPCTPGAGCAVRVLVQLQPHPGPRTVAWTFQVIDRCTGGQRGVPGGAVSVAPGAGQAQAVSTVPLPQGRALAVLAVTSEPANAASGPLLVPSRQGSC